MHTYKIRDLPVTINPLKDLEVEIDYIDDGVRKLKEQIPKVYKEHLKIQVVCEINLDYLM